MSRTKDAGKPVEIGEDNGTRTVYLTMNDFVVLKHMAAGAMQVKHCEKDFCRLRAMGLVKHRWDESQDWPVALVELTPAGNQALAQEFA